MSDHQEENCGVLFDCQDCLIREDLRQSKKAEEVEEGRRRMTMTVEERLAEDIKVEMKTDITRHGYQT